MAAELVRLKVDAIVSGSSAAIGALQKATTTIPIVMATSADPIGSGFVKSLARPGGNITGFSHISGDIGTKQLGLLLGVAPKLSRVAVLVNPTNPSLSTFLKTIQSAAQGSSVKVLPVEARTAQEIENAFRVMTQAKAEAVIVATDPLFVQHYRKIADLAAKNRFPSSSFIREYVEVGGLMSYGPNLSEQFRRAATYVDKIFKGAKPGDLPVEQITTFELFINGRTAKALGLTIPQSLLLRADRVIE
jgi:putative ABC transport system substrate-binding protein